MKVLYYNPFEVSAYCRPTGKEVCHRPSARTLRRKAVKIGGKEGEAILNAIGYKLIKTAEKG